MTINEFSDFQCPFCRRLALDLARVRAERPQEVSIVFHHYPIQALHPHARAAAAAAACAGLQGRFEAFRDLLFAHQPDIGSVPWLQFARAAGVEDTSRFSRCLVDPATERRVRRDIQLGNELGLQGTPTVLINDILVAGAVPLPVLDSLIRLALERSRPVLE